MAVRLREVVLAYGLFAQLAPADDGSCPSTPIGWRPPRRWQGCASLVFDLLDEFEGNYHFERQYDGILAA
jgi:hypothetical protein